MNMKLKLALAMVVGTYAATHSSLSQMVVKQGSTGPAGKEFSGENSKFMAGTPRKAPALIGDPVTIAAETVAPQILNLHHELAHA